MNKLLIIEDDRILMETASEFFSEEGYEVLKASQGELGIELALKHHPDLILCDICMPGIDGYEVFARLQSTMATSQIPFIFMTAKAEKEDIRMGMQMGVDDYITKPIDFLQLKKSISVRLQKFEQSSERSEIKYHTLFELANEAIMIIKPPQGTVLDTNKASLALLGYEKHELLGLNGETFMAATEVEPHFLSWQKGINKASYSMRETQWKHKDGHLIPVQVSGTSISISGEALFLIIARDISELKEKERILRESENRYHELVVNTGEGIAIVNTDETFTYANPAACEIFGLPAELLIGKPLSFFLDPSTIDEINRQTSIRREGKKSIYEIEFKRQDGERRWIVVTATPQFDKDLNFIGTFGIFRDITQRKLAENRVLESEQRFRTIVNLTNDWIWEIDPDGKYSFVSQQIFNCLGYQPEEVIGKTPFDFLLPEDISEVGNTIYKLVNERKPLIALQNRARHKDGRLVYLETSASPVINEKGVYMGYRGADRDITLRKLYENGLIVAKEKAEESDKLKSSILANMSHELRTPLNGILGFAEILKEELRSTNYENMVDNIHSSGKRLMTTLNSIITLSQLEGGKITVAKTDVNLEIAIKSIIKSMQSLADEKHIKLNTSGLKPYIITTDDHLLRQLLRQIIYNAIKFTDNGGVSVEFGQAKDADKKWVVITVADTGIGIDKSYFKLIFQEFRQVSEGFGRKYQGSGVGLTISKKIIDLLEGKITIESEPGKGASFSIWLPDKLEPVAKETIKQIPSEEGHKKPTIPKKDILPLVLLVEDNIVNRDLTTFFLRNVCIVDYAGNATEAIKMVGEKQYSAILMDINLGYGMNGLEATKAIRLLPGYEKTPIIAVTGYTLDEDRESLFEAGCTGYLPKPFDKKTLLNVIENAWNEEIK